MVSATNILINVAYHQLASIDDLVHPLLRRLHDDWHAASNGVLPGHDFIDPLKLSYLLSHLLVVEVVHAAGGLRFHYRLIGTALVNRRQKDYTGAGWMSMRMPKSPRPARLRAASRWKRSGPCA